MGIRKGSPYVGLNLGTNVYKARPETHFLQSTSYKVRPRRLQLRGKNRSRALIRRRSFEKDHSFVLGKTKIFNLKVEQPKAFLITFCAQKVIVLELFKKLDSEEGLSLSMTPSLTTSPH